MYADIKAILEKLDVEEANTVRTHRHIPCAIGNVIISRIPENRYHGKYVEFVGADCMTTFIDYLEEVAHQVYSWDTGFETRVRAQRTKVEIRLFDMENQCYLCGFPFEGVDGNEKQKHFDHDHLTGHYRGAACAWCNRKMRLSR